LGGGEGPKCEKIHCGCDLRAGLQVEQFLQRQQVEGEGFEEGGRVSIPYYTPFGV